MVLILMAKTFRIILVQVIRFSQNILVKNIFLSKKCDLKEIKFITVVTFVQ